MTYTEFHDEVVCFQTSFILGFKFLQSKVKIGIYTSITQPPLSRYP